MTNWTAKLLKLLWAATLPLRRPFVRKIHTKLDRALAPLLHNFDQLHRSLADQGKQLQCVHARLAEIEQKFAMAHGCFRDDLSPTLDGVVRDLARLQMQLELLQEALSSSTPADQHSDVHSILRDRKTA